MKVNPISYFFYVFSKKRLKGRPDSPWLLKLREIVNSFLKVGRLSGECKTGSIPVF